MQLDLIISTTVMNVTRLLDTTNELISNITGQVLNGFLNDVSSNVLCEGWLQALLTQLLCTASDFSLSLLPSQSVRGTIDRTIGYVNEYIAHLDTAVRSHCLQLS